MMQQEHNSQPFIMVNHSGVNEIFEIQRPSESIRHMHSVFKGEGEAFMLARGRQLTLEPHFIYLLTQGAATLVRKKDGLHIQSEEAPIFFNLTSLFNNSPLYDIIASTPCKGRLLATESMKRVIYQQELWPQLSEIQSYFLQRQAIRDQYFLGVDSYEKIRNCLRELMSEPLDIRLSISVQQYIRQRTHMSRSGIMKVLSGLREGGYITINRGRLIDTTILPNKY